MWKQRGKSHRGDFLERTVHTGLDLQARDALEREATSPVLLWAGGKKIPKPKAFLGPKKNGLAWKASSFGR